jgi:hypothetical protein
VAEGETSSTNSLMVCATFDLLPNLPSA